MINQFKFDFKHLFRFGLKYDEADSFQFISIPF